VTIDGAGNYPAPFFMVVVVIRDTAKDNLSHGFTRIITDFSVACL
jgi:hypothetical protein